MLAAGQPARGKSHFGGRWARAYDGSGPPQALRDGIEPMPNETIPGAIAVLLDEHAEGRRFFGPLIELPASADEAQAVAAERLLELTTATLAYLADRLEEHIEKEEGPLFPMLKARLPADDRLIDEMVAEHDQIRMQRDELRAAIEELLGGHEQVRQQRDELRAAVEAFAARPDAGRAAALQRAARKVADTAAVHFENEEELVFPLAPELLTAAELEEVAVAIGSIGERWGRTRASGTM